VLPVDGDWEIALDRPNALRLNRWQIVCDDNDDWSGLDCDDTALPEVQALPLQYLDQRVKEVRQQCERNGDSPIGYRRHITCKFVPENLAILVENGAIDGEWELFVNGTQFERGDFSGMEYNGADKVACNVAKLFHVGENVVALRVRNAPAWGGLRTPLHLIGDFGLAGSDRRTLCELPTSAHFNKLVEAGLPHFSGTVTYRRTLALEPFKDSASLALPPGFGDVVEVALGGRSLGVRAWSPYVWAAPDRGTLAKTGEVELNIRVTNTLLPFIEGQRWDFETQKPICV
jgi:hypothetical protein